MTNEQNNKRIAKNTLMLYFRMILTMLVSLYTSRVVLNVLGVEDYGTYNVVGGVVTMFGFFNGAMSSATQRFLSFDLGRKDYVQLRKTFNATQLIHIGIALLIFVLAQTIGLWFVNTQLNLPEDRMEAARWVYHFAVLSFMVSIIQVPYNAVIIARERMNVYAYMSILEVLLKLLIVFMLTWIAFDKLKLYGILLFVVSFIVAAIYRIYTLRHFDETRFELVKDKALYNTLISFSGWTMFGSISVIITNQGIPILVNRFLGVVLNASIGIANQVNLAVYSFVNSFQTAFRPHIIKLYAQGNFLELNSTIRRTMKFSFFIVLIIIIPILLYTEMLLEIWLKVVPAYAVDFTRLMLIIALIEALSGPLWITINAIGKIKKYQIVISLLLLINLPIAFFILYNNISPVYIFVSQLAITFLAYFYRIFFISNRLAIKNSYFIKFNLMILGISLLLLLLNFLLKFLFFDKVTSIPLLLGAVTLSFLLSTCIIWIVGLSKPEKKFIKSFLKK